MSESSGQEANWEPVLSKNGMAMSLAERVHFGCWLSIKVMLSFLGLVVGYVLLITLEGSLVSRLWPQQRLGRPLVMMLLAPSVLYLCMSIILAVFFIRRMIRRKRRTGSFLATGEELKVTRERFKGPTPWWKKIAINATFYFIAIGTTYSALIFRPFWVSNLVAPALMWLVAIAVTTAAFQHSEPKWTLPVLAGLYCLAALYCTFALLAGHHGWSDGGTFTALMWAFTALFAMGTFLQSAQQGSRAITKGDSQAPPEAVDR
ncbi:MAG: hypothetical protein ABSC48_16290 [Terracidiphilus sp.]|jgi:uncharacterized membrane protein YqjE